MPVGGAQCSRPIRRCDVAVGPVKIVLAIGPRALIYGLDGFVSSGVIGEPYGIRIHPFVKFRVPIAETECGAGKVIDGRAVPPSRA